MPVRPIVRGEERIPLTGPFVVVANHYERDGLWMLWPAMLISHLVQRRANSDTHWVAIEEWESFSIFGIPIPPSATKRVFDRAYTTFGIIAMPAAHAPPARRAKSMRVAVQAVKEGKIIGLMPEGDVGRTPELLPAREGVGTFLLLLAEAGARIVPIGLFEEGGHLVANIGNPFDLRAPADLLREKRQQWASDRAMLAVRDLLPGPLWGAYRENFRNSGMRVNG
jgi:1-acyl-sn-glycerol-3-phosphate acyltransferase